MFLQSDFVLNGQGHGEVGSLMGQMRFDPGMMRPYLDGERGRSVSITTGYTFNAATGMHVPVAEEVPISELLNNGLHSPVFNATSLRKDEWIMLDQRVVMAARQRLRAWSDLAAANTFSVPGMSKTMLEHETMSDVGEAVVDMDGLTDGRNASPRFQLEAMPLPITHSDFHFSSRKLAESRNAGTPLDTALAENAGRRVAEMVEKTLIGTVTGVQYGTGSEYGTTPKVYGYTNFPGRATKNTMTAPTGSNGSTVKDDWLALRDLLYDANFYGPYMAYVSSDYDRYLDQSYSTSEPSAGTLREQLLKIDGIQSIKRLDYLTNTFTVLLVQMTSDVAQAVNGMDITTVQWESRGGMQLNFKVMCIWAPRLRADYNGNCGIAHGTTA